MKKKTNTQGQVSLQISTDQGTKDTFRTMCRAEGRDGDGLLRAMMYIYERYLDAQRTDIEVRNVK